MIFCSHKVFYFFCIEQTTITFYHEKIVYLRRLFIFFFLLRSQSSVQQKAIVVKRMIEKNHLSPRPVDDSFSLSMFNNIIRSADPGQRLFTNAEYKTLSAYRFALDDELQERVGHFLIYLLHHIKRH